MLKNVYEGLNFDRKCIYRKSIFAKCTRLTCLLSFASFFFSFSSCSRNTAYHAKVWCSSSSFVVKTSAAVQCTALPVIKNWNWDYCGGKIEGGTDQWRIIPLPSYLLISEMHGFDHTILAIEHSCIMNKFLINDLSSMVSVFCRIAYIL